MEQLLYNRSYQLRNSLRMISRAIGPMRDRTALCVGTAIPRSLRARLVALGGNWTFHDESGLLPYAAGAFDRVLLLDHLEKEPDDYAFMADLHRVLQPAGLLYIDTTHQKKWSVFRPLQRLLAGGERDDAPVRTGYTESNLFDLLKDGFDVQDARTYSRFFSQAIETFFCMALAAFTSPEALDTAGDGDEAFRKEEETERPLSPLHIIQTCFYPLFILAAHLDWLLFFARGYRLQAVARRRLWKPRRSPVLRDGRTLADATLNTRIGTARPF